MRAITLGIVKVNSKTLSLSLSGENVVLCDVSVEGSPDVTVDLLRRPCSTRRLSYADFGPCTPSMGHERGRHKCSRRRVRRH